MKRKKIFILILSLLILSPRFSLAANLENQTLNTREVETLNQSTLESQEEILKAQEKVLQDQGILEPSTDPTADKSEGQKNLTSPGANSSKYEKAVILEVGKFSSDDGFGNRVQEVKIKLLTGKDKGEKITTTNTSSIYAPTNFNLKAGQKVMVLESSDDLGQEISSTPYTIVDYVRTDSLYILIGLFILALVLIGRKKGLLAILSLGFTFAIILFAAIPLIIKGYSPILISVVTSVLIVVFTLLMVGGPNKKSLSAILGTSFGTIIAGFIAFYVGNKIHLTGLSLEETQMLLYLPNDLVLDPKELLFAGIIWGALGAVMDVGMSISSSIHEIASVNQELGFKELLKSGMNVGRDIMSTMSNTLILAYLGSTLPLFLLMIIFNESNYKIMNLDVIATEVVRSISGSIGLILSIPITAAIASYFSKKRN